MTRRQFHAAGIAGGLLHAASPQSGRPSNVLLIVSDQPARTRDTTVYARYRRGDWKYNHFSTTHRSCTTCARIRGR